MAAYEWINLDNDNSYNQLVGLLDSDFNSQDIVEILKKQISSAAKGMLVEYGYVDKDYRSTFYNFYAKKGRCYRTDCVRLHLFDKAVSYDSAHTNIICTDGRLQHHYFGYIVLRPTLVATLGRTVLSPDIRTDATGLAIQSIHHVNLLGHQLPVWGFPSMAQHVDIAVCAHVSCWAILRYYSETFAQHREYLIHDITKLTSPFDPGGLVSSLGFGAPEAKRVFQAAGCFPLHIKNNVNDSGEDFFSQMFAYLDSGFPLYASIDDEKHVVVLIGYRWHSKTNTETITSSFHIWHRVQSFLVIDDNSLPYTSIPIEKSHSVPYSVRSIRSFIVALPEKIYYPVNKVDVLSRKIEKLLVDCRSHYTEPIHFRRYFITTIAKLREHARKNQSHLGKKLVKIMMQLETAQYVWVIEYCSETQWTKGHITARAIVDATASPEDPMPIWLLHCEKVARIYDRSSFKDDDDDNTPTEELNRSDLGPMSRIEINLRAIVET